MVMHVMLLKILEKIWVENGLLNWMTRSMPIMIFLQIHAGSFRECPLSFVIVSTDRRTGHYISDILKKFIDS